MEFDYSRVYPLEGKIQHYAWGGMGFIPELLGKKPGAEPSAEYWMGAHDKAPATVEIDENDKLALNDIIALNPAAALGIRVNEVFHSLPYLFKILDVKDMLSIQVHPSKEAAVKDFAAENEKGIALTDPSRNYKDDNHKPELALALGDFWLLHGFKPEDKLLACLSAVPELEFLVPLFQEKGYAALYSHVMHMPQSEVNEILQPLLDRIIPAYEAGQLNRSQEDFWAARAAETFNTEGRIDRGIFSIYFFNVVAMKKGDAIFQDAGVPHAYLEGQNAEIMANSDNVLRGGLTVKHIDVEELLRHTRCEATDPNLIKGVAAAENELIFPTPAADFELSRIELRAGDYTTVQSNTTEVFLVYEGEVKLKSSNELDRKRGEAAVVFADRQVDIMAEADSVVLRASVPSQPPVS